MKVSVAIAAYFGNRDGIPNGYIDDCLFFIKTHLEVLEKIDEEISKIYIVCTYQNDSDRNMNYITSYFYSILENNPKIVILNRPNLGGSYAGWHNALEFDNNESDYIVFVEDDYALVNTSIQTMLEYYEETPNMIYLCELWNNDRYTKDGMDITGHAQISNGMINNKLYNKLKSQSNLDFTLYLLPGKMAIYNNQVSFLEQYRSNGILIRDMKEKCSCVFNCDSNSVINFCNPTGPDVFIPITNWYPNHNPNLRYNW
jgi:hypothetical protein